MSTKAAPRQRDETLEIPGDIPLKVTRNSPMSRYTTWRIGGPADFVIRAGTTDELIAAVRWGASEGLPVCVIGAGSNLLAGDGGIRGLVIVARTPGERAEHHLSAEDGGGIVRVKVGAQAPLSWTGRYCSERGWSGMEWGSGLPGAIGGATINNAGAHGTEQKDHLTAVTLLHKDGEIETHDKAWLDASYRMTRLKAIAHPRPWTVLSVELALPKADPEELKRLADEHADYRHATQPTGRCAGSTFTNPPGDFAGRLLEEAGLKEFGVGGVRFSSIHSNFIVNDGSGTAADVRELIQIARERVKEQFGIDLHPEIEEIGER